jgi:DNA-directed RNA polymerase specialized sigma24 family protein
MDLQTLRDRHNRIDNLKERIERLRAAMELGARQLRVAPARNAVRNKLEEDMAKLDELERELIGEIAALEQEVQDAKQLLEGLPVREQLIIRLRYVEGLSWRRVARKAHYTEKHCLKIHRAALKRILNDTF